MSTSKPKRIWIIAGESSGDIYGARLARAIKAQEPGTLVQGMGGDAMTEEGVDILVNSSDLAIVGFVEVIKHLNIILKVFYGLLSQARELRPDAVVLIDYPGFNVRFAKRLHKLGIHVVYYVSPQVWAWGKRRIPKIAKYVDKMLVIFPFEVDVYRGTGLDVEFVGHPLPEILKDYTIPESERDPSTVLLLPGSRKTEVNSLLADMVGAASVLLKRKPELNVVIASPRPKVTDYINSVLEELPRDMVKQVAPTIVEGKTREWMQHASAGLAASGTVTMEAAILGLPLAVGYKLSPMSYLLARILVKIKYFTIVNLVADKLVYEEHLQHNVTAGNLAESLESILPGGSRREEVLQGMHDAVEAIGGDRDDVFKQAAEAVLKTAGTKK